MMARPTDQNRLHELRHLWHSLTGYMRGVKGEDRFSAIHDLSLVETGTIDLIAENPGIIMREIGEALHLPKSTLTSVVDRLEKRGYVHRVISSRDRRSFGVELSDTGRRVYEDHVQFESVIWQRIMCLLEDDAERDSFVGSLNKIVKGLPKS